MILKSIDYDNIQVSIIHDILCFTYSNECFCGTDEPPLSSKMPDSSCNFKCPGDAHATCGGYYTINIFQTGIKSKHHVIH